ncbi:hypothetical protein M2D63_017810 [Pseudomonas sp. BJa5]|uniref:hypothetical protein n=1 Tax=Pseudomonas sp. BJa5 TaxID=2936270 RepID=UPI0025599DE6|nr:hypothetical protein [Pseudomonas sp. BGr12]MDL2422974.1 hypothetical protein [Pseudomonas sp. BGr12]
MSRRFNFTGREKILKEDVRISINFDGCSSICNVHLWLGEYDIRPDASVIVEAQRGRVIRLRHSWGHAGQAFTEEGASSNFDISAMGDPDDIRFRILVVDPDSCQLLATAEGVDTTDREDSNTPQRSLLPIIMQDLSGGIWELEMGEIPTLLLDTSLGSKNDLKSSPVLHAILPGVIRAILINLAHEQEGSADDEEDLSTWLSLGKRWAGYIPPSNSTHQEIDDWAQKATIAFCREKKLRNRLANFINQED